MIPPVKTTVTVFFALGALVGTLTAPTAAGKYPWDWVPMWEGKRESALLNAANIVSITPIFDPSIPANKLKNNKAEYLEVRMVDGTTCEIYEDFDEFFSRIRNAQQ